MAPPKALKKGQKQIDQENVATLAFYRNISIVAMSVYAVITIVFFELQWKSYIAMTLPALIYFACYKFMNTMISGGMDLAMEGGMGEHAKDLLLITAIIQSLSLFSNYMWLLFLIVPLRAFYMLWVNILAPWFFAAAPQQELDEKQQKKMERKMKRQQRVYR